MKATFLRLVNLLLLVSGMNLSALADVRIKTRTTMEGGQPSESTVYIKGARQRTEYGGTNTDILQCDMKRSIDINEREKTYTITSLVQDTAQAAGTAAGSARPATQPSATGARRGGVITYTTTTTDMKESKRFPQFGNILAHRYKRVMEIKSSPDACTPMNMRMESDGWYANLQADLACNIDYAQMARRYATQRSCQDKTQSNNVGPVVKGYAIYETATTTFEMNMGGQNVSRTSASTREVVELSNAPLSAALFEVPAGYRESKDGGTNMTGGDDTAADDDDDAGTNTNAGSGTAGGNMTAKRPNESGAQPVASSGNPATPAVALGAKKAGVMRVGVVLPKATAGEGVDPSGLAAAVRNGLVATLKGPALEVTPIEARLPGQIELEAREKECDFILYTNVAHKKGGGGGFGGFLKKAAPVIDAVPMGYGTAGAVADATARVVVYTAADIASSVKAKDEITIDYRLMSAAQATTPVAAKTLKGKAKSDGEDVLTPLIEQEATAVLASASKN